MGTADKSRALGGGAVAVITFACVLAPAEVARAAGGGGRLLVIFFALPVLLPVIGVFAAIIGLRRTNARWLWWTLCALLALNAALFGMMYRETALSFASVALSLLQLAYATSMVFTFSEAHSAARVQTIAWRCLCVLGCGVLPALMTALGGD